MAGTITQEMHAVLASDAEDEAVSSVREQYFAFMLFCDLPEVLLTLTIFHQ